MNRRNIYRKANREFKVSPSDVGGKLSPTQKLRAIQGGLRERVVRAKRAARSMDRYGHKNPWIVAGALSAVLGFLGYILGRTKRS